MSREWEEAEGDLESEASSRLWAISTEPDVGLKLMNCEIMTLAEVSHLTDGATQAPLVGPLFHVHFHAIYTILSLIIL